MKFFVFFALIAIFVGGSESFVVDCEYHDYGATSLGYTCDVKNAELITSRDDREITGIRGLHLSGKTDDDVVGFDVQRKIVKFFPRGLTKFFKNIKIIRIVSSDLQEITKDDLKEFQQQLEKLYLQNNKIKHIEDGTFSELENLKTLLLNHNPCTYRYDRAENDRSKVLEVIRKVEKSCKDPNDIPATTTTTTPKPTTTTENPETAKKNQEISTLTSNLTATIEILKAQKDENKKLSEENLKLKLENSENLKLKDENLKLLEINQKINEENQKLKEKNEIEKEILEKFSSLEGKIEQLEGQISTKLDQKVTEILTSTQKIEQLEGTLTQKCDFTPKCIELDEKIEKLPSKVADESKKYFEDLKVDQKISIIAQEAIIKSNVEKSMKNLKHYGAQISTMRSELGIKIEEFCQK